VLGGLLAKSGMASFKNSLNDSDVEAIHQYILKLQKDAFERQQH
jgi:hypothetical protein